MHRTHSTDPKKTRYIYTCIHTYIHKSIHTYIHTYRESRKEVLKHLTGDSLPPEGYTERIAKTRRKFAKSGTQDFPDEEEQMLLATEAEEKRLGRDKGLLYDIDNVTVGDVDEFDPHGME